MPAIFKPTKAEWRTIKEVAFHGSYTPAKPILTIAGVHLECREHVNTEDRSIPTSINAMLVTRLPREDDIRDCDLYDKSKSRTDEFRAGSPLSADGSGFYDFYIYNRYDLANGEVAGNVLVEVLDGKMARIWIEGGNDWSWTPEGGIQPVSGRR